MIKSLLKRLLYTVAPRRTTEWMSARARAHSHGVTKSWGCDVIAELMFSRLGDRVLEGPFAGMRLTESTKLEHIAPFLLGTYESELERAWDVILAGSYDRIFDVGAKFGYYAVGLARRYPAASVVAFDTDPWARHATLEMTQANGVGNVSVKGFCDPVQLVADIGETSFVISDCEGYESQLFTDSIVSKLRTTTMIIETHDDLVPGVTQDLTTRLSQSHSLFTIRNDEGGRTTREPLDFLSEGQRALAVKEVRPEQSWLICFAKTGPNAALAARYQAANS